MIKIKVTNNRNYPIFVNTSELGDLNYEFQLPARVTVVTECSSLRHLDNLINEHPELTFRLIEE